MSSPATPRDSIFTWSDDALELRFDVDEQGVARLRRLAPAAPAPEPAADDRAHAPAPAPASASASAGQDPPDGDTGLPLLDVLLAGSGRHWSGRRYSESSLGTRMRYVGHEQRDEEPWSVLEVALQDPVTGLEATVCYRRLAGVGVLRSSVTLTNAGGSPLTLQSVSSFLGGGLAGPGGDLADVELLWAENDWKAESRWRSRGFREALPELGEPEQNGRSRGRFGLTSTGTWSSGTYLPMGAAVNRRTGHTILWQIEHNGGWHWQAGEHSGPWHWEDERSHANTSYLALLGPTDAEHHWRVTLAPGESFETVPVAVALSGSGLEDATGRLTRYRRAMRRRHEDHRRLPVIFNDYLNTLNADPSTERLLPLIDAAAAAGAEYFCIDAGWYAEPGEGWWDAVGDWLPAEARFTGGFAHVIERIRAAGLVPGMWIEPEVVGVRSPVARRLPDEAFFTRGGERVVEQARHQLDLRHPAARAHLDRSVDHLVNELGIGYLKMDYNINVAPGTDSGDRAAGAGMLEHNRAFLAWIDALLDRHPGLTVESCSSGAMRADYGILSRFQLQSTSDQDDPLRYPPIAAAAPLAIAPEQAAVWAPVQPEMSDDLIAFTLCGAMLGRFHLSGHLDRMTPAQQQLVASAISTYQRIRADLAQALPFWPLGLPGWRDAWLAAGMRGPSSTYLVVWRRHPASEEVVSLPVAAPGTVAQPQVLYPHDAGVQLEWRASDGELGVTLPRTPSACLIAFDRALPPPPRPAAPTLLAR